MAGALALSAACSPSRREQTPAPPIPKPNVDPARVPRPPVRVPPAPPAPDEPPLERLGSLADGFHPLGVLVADAGGHRWTREAGLPLLTRNTMR